MINFNHRLSQAVEQHQSLLCVGLDPDIKRIPPQISREAEPLFTFNKHIIDATADYVCAFKPQIAYYAALGAERQLIKTIAYIKEHYPAIPVILDAKRGDIGATAQQYAEEAFTVYQADAVTLNPYMGYDAVEPFLERKDKGIILLCRTSNPGAAAIQDIQLADGRRLYEHIAGLAANQWNDKRNIALVVGATCPEQMAAIRKIAGDMTFLVPGIGTQGGSVDQVLSVGLNQYNRGIILNASRSVLYHDAIAPERFAEAARAEAKRMQALTREYL